MSRIFISYRRDDAAWQAGRLADALRLEFGKESVFIDVATIQPGSAFPRALEAALAECQVMIAVIGKSWTSIASRRHKETGGDPDYVAMEISSGLRRGIVVIPVLIDGANLPTRPERQGIPASLHPLFEHQGIHLRHDTFSQDFQRLAEIMRAALAAAPRGREEISPTEAYLRSRGAFRSELLYWRWDGIFQFPPKIMRDFVENLAYRHDYLVKRTPFWHIFQSPKTLIKIRCSTYKFKINTLTGEPMTRLNVEVSDLQHIAQALLPKRISPERAELRDREVQEEMRRFLGFLDEADFGFLHTFGEVHRGQDDESS